jgi:hypothetical protein
MNSVPTKPLQGKIALITGAAAGARTGIGSGAGWRGRRHYLQELIA